MRREYSTRWGFYFFHDADTIKVSLEIYGKKKLFIIHVFDDIMPKLLFVKRLDFVQVISMSYDK